MPKVANIFEICPDVGITIQYANQREADILKAILINEARKLNPEINIS